MWKLVFKKYAVLVLSKRWFYLALGIGIFVLDALTGRYLSFPILFVLPVASAALYCSSRVSYALAVLLPLGRLVLVMSDTVEYQLAYSASNVSIRVAVLLLIAYLVSRTARQTRELKARVESMVMICAWSRTVKYEGEWISFEQYLLRRFKISTSHGISPAEAKRLFGDMENSENPAPDAQPLSSTQHDP
jgi:hypothetical protein